MIPKNKPLVADAGAVDLDDVGARRYMALGDVAE